MRLLALAVAVGVPILVRPWLCDDVFITLRYVQQALAGHGLVYNPGERVEGYTHFLWTILLWAPARAGVDPETVARWLPLPFYAGSVLVLAQTSRALFEARASRIWGIPLAALLWALHRDAHVFASGGLETAAFTFFLLLGFRFLVRASTNAGAGRAPLLAIWSYALAALTRPEGLGHLAMALLYLALGAGRDAAARRRPHWGRICGLALLLVVPLYAWRFVYYGDLLPNSFRAKSAGRAYGSQGWTYVGLYFRFYAPLFVAAAGAVLALLPRRRSQTDVPSTALLRLALAHALLVVFATVYVGGDFMFARFLLPATPFLLLLCEHAVLSLRSGVPVAAVLLTAGLVGGGVWRESALRGLNFALHGIVDERSQYPAELLAKRRAQSERLAACFAATRAVFLIQGSQASYAYWGRFPVAIEAHGLTDRTIARTPLARRGRPGHERQPPFDYLLERRTNFLLHLPGAHVQRPFARITFGDVLGEILVYDRALMQEARQCGDVEFVDFPGWFDAWSERADSLDVEALRRDAQAFRLYYFDHNEDRGRSSRLEALLANAASR